jgi:acetylserotonin N-methyltransferase
MIISSLMLLPDPAPVLDLIEAFRRSKTMFAALSLGVFDRLREQSFTAPELALCLKADPCSLERLLDGCVSLGLLRKQEGKYANEPVSDVYLSTASPSSVHGYILYSDQVLYPMWANLADAVRAGTNRWNQTFGLDGPIFNHFFRTGEAMRDFILGMHALGLLSSPKVVTAFDLSSFHRLVDLGGATGHLVIAACERYPGLTGAVFDLGKVAPIAREQVAGSRARDRIEVLSGDFFEDELPDADLYALGQILHDWPEEKIAALLKIVFGSLPPGGALLIAERLLDEDKEAPLAGLMQSLNMLIVTEGRERTAAEYTALLHQAGFTQVEARRTGSRLDVILATKT